MPLETIASRFGTPCYVYSRAALESRFRAFDGAFAGNPGLGTYLASLRPTAARRAKLPVPTEPGTLMIRGGQLLHDGVPVDVPAADLPNAAAAFARARCRRALFHCEPPMTSALHTSSLTSLPLLAWLWPRIDPLTHSPVSLPETAT